MAIVIMDSSNITREVTVGLEAGLHMTPILSLTVLAQKFTCEISLHKGDRRADVKSYLDLMSLMAPQGTRLLLCAQGPDALAAVEALGQLFDNDFRPAEEC